MKFKKSLLGNMISMAITTSVFATVAQAQSIPSEGLGPISAAGSAPSITKTNSTGSYIVQLKAVPAISRAQELGELLPSNQLVAQANNNYNPDTPNMQAYNAVLKELQSQVADEIGVEDVLSSYTHTFNGFSARLTQSQVAALRNHPDVSAVYEDQVFQPTTSNTPAFLGLTGPGGQHTEGNKGEDVIVGILDSGIWPENPSFSSDGTTTENTYDAPAGDWADKCNVGTVGEFRDAEGAVVYDDSTVAADDAFTCNNKLIGAQYFGSNFSSTYEIRFDLGEFASPRDADGHGSHTASTAAGNAGVTATRGGVDIGTVSGIAPRARISAYKVCWNSNYESPEEVAERGCFFSDSMAAIDQAVADGVDVLNYSIGNSNNINTPVYNAALRALEAGVFMAASAGNDGSDAGTVGNIAPWQATVAASTYTGEVPVIGEALQLQSPDSPTETIFSIEGDITAEAPEGFSGNLVATSPALMCDEDANGFSGNNPITNAEAIAGNIALIARGACAFSEKILYAQEAGATGVVVYSDNRAPTAMGGDSAGITIPGRMITNADGLSLASQLDEIAITATWTNESATTNAQVEGNTIADFSSRGVNPQSGDIIKPDITAPGVQILAANSEDQLDFGNFEDGEPFHYLQGTSMSSPHIAGMAALLREAHPDWSPSQIKSAMMTSARQDLTKEDGTTPADPFDFGAGHLDPIPADNPGLTYDTNVRDYYAYLCGQDEAALVATFGDSCAALDADGFSTDASQLNLPSIAIAQLEDPETITRTVTDVTGVGGIYTVNVDAPAGIDVEVRTFDSEGNETDTSDLEVSANGKASYSLTFSRGEGFVAGQYAFGSVTLMGPGGVEVRSPIAINPVADILIQVPESLSIKLTNGFGFFPVTMNYTGLTSMDYAGLVAPFGDNGNVPQDPDQRFSFNEAGLVRFNYLVAPGTKVLRFSLRDALVANEGSDLDLYVYRCAASTACVQVARGVDFGSDEDIILTNPEPAVFGEDRDFYLVWVHGWDVGGDKTLPVEEQNTDFTLLSWFAEGPSSNTRIMGSRLAIQGRPNMIRMIGFGLDPSTLYMGGVTFYNDAGEPQGTTVLEVQP